MTNALMQLLHGHLINDGSKCYITLKPVKETDRHIYIKEF